MNFLLQSKPTHFRHSISHNICRSLSSLFYSTQSLSSFFTSSPTSIVPLQSRILRSGDPKASVVSVLEQWLEEGKTVSTHKLQSLIKKLRSHSRFGHALQISEWMSDQKSSTFTHADVAIHLDLISKVHGLQAAENYFNKIPEASRHYQIYGALLNCYASKKKLGEAEALMEKMRDLGFLKTSLPYNAMLNLYCELGEEEKMDVLLKDMQRQGINFDVFTLNIQMKLYGLTGNVEEIDKLLMKMESDPRIKMQWNSYVTAVNGYLKAGSTEKATTALKKAEKLVNDRSRKSAYEMFLTQYAAVGSKDDVHRIWNLYKNMGRTFNSGYLCMLSSMVKFDDIDEAERIWEEWESSKNTFDLRIANLMITTYSKKGLSEKAELCVNKIMENGREPNSTTWDRMADLYIIVGEMVKATEMLKKALSASKPFENWKPKNSNTVACIKFLKSKGDEAAAQELLKMVKENCNFSSAEYNILVDCISNEE